MGAGCSMMVLQPEPGTSQGLRRGIGPSVGMLDHRSAGGPAATSEGEMCRETGPQTGGIGQ